MQVETSSIYGCTTYMMLCAPVQQHLHTTAMLTRMSVYDIQRRSTLCFPPPLLLLLLLYSLLLQCLFASWVV